VADERKRSMAQLEIKVHARAHSVHAWRVKRLLRSKGYAFESIDVAGDADSRLREANGNGTAPRVFVDGRLVGGLREINALNRSGDLDRLVYGKV